MRIQDTKINRWNSYTLSRKPDMMCYRYCCQPSACKAGADNWRKLQAANSTSVTTKPAKRVASNHQSISDEELQSLVQ